MTFPRIHLGQVLVPTSRPEAVDPQREYKLLGARWYAGGLFVKDRKRGGEIKAKTLYRVEEGDFVYNRLFAWKGSFAVASADNHGCYVSNEFPAYRVRADLIESRYLAIFFRRESVWNEALGLSTGGTPTSRNRLNEERLLSMQIPLPPLEEQRRIVARVEELIAKIEEARGLRKVMSEEFEALLRSMLGSTRDGQIITTPMSELVSLRSPDVVANPMETYHFAGVYSFGRGVFPGPVKRGDEFSYDRLTRLRSGNFVYPKLMAWEGALGVVPAECDQMVVSPEFPVFEVNQDRVLPEVLDVYFRTPSVWQAISGTSTGTNVRRRRLNPRDFLALEFPLPPMTVQQQLQQVYSVRKQVARIRSETEAELSALVPAILDQAFRGEL